VSDCIIIVLFPQLFLSHIYLHSLSNMGICIVLWRARIGCYNLSNAASAKLKVNISDSNFSNAKFKLLSTILAFLLVIGGVEPHPGPPKNDQQQPFGSKEILTLE
jgi:hypothetical protein